MSLPESSESGVEIVGGNGETSHDAFPARDAYLTPGTTVRFRCTHCAEIYRQTVQPRRDTERALRRLDNQDYSAARKLIEDAHEDLRRIADYINDIEAR